MPRTIQQAQREGYEDGYHGRDENPEAEPGSLTHEAYMTGYANGDAERVEDDRRAEAQAARLSEEADRHAYATHPHTRRYDPDNAIL